MCHSKRGRFSSGDGGNNRSTTAMPVVHKVTADTVGGEPRDTAAVVDETPQTQPELAVAELTLLGDGRAGVNDGMSVFDRTPPRTALTDGLGGVNRSGDGMSVLEQTPRMAHSDGLRGVNRSRDEVPTLLQQITAAGPSMYFVQVSCMRLWPL